MSFIKLQSDEGRPTQSFENIFSMQHYSVCFVRNFERLFILCIVFCSYLLHSFTVFVSNILALMTMVSKRKCARRSAHASQFDRICWIQLLWSVFWRFPFHCLCSFVWLTVVASSRLIQVIWYNKFYSPKSFITDRSKVVLLLWFILIVNVRLVSVGLLLIVHFILDSLVAICLERASPLAFHLCCFYLVPS